MNLKKKSKLLELVALDSTTPADFKFMTEQCIADIKAAEQELTDLRAQQESGEESKADKNRRAGKSLTLRFSVCFLI